jgi:F-type H+-transporting ATPase subunit a
MLAALLLSAALAAAAEPPPPEHSPAAGHATDAPAHEAAAAEHDAAASGHEPAAGGHEASAGEHESVGPAEVLMHHVLDGPAFGFWSKHLAFFVIAAVLVLVLARLAIRSYRKRMPSGVGTLVETFVVFIRDEIAEKNIGHDGRRFTPLLCSFFFFILIAALLGLIPFPQYADGHWSFAGTTSTGNLAVTMALATISFFAQQWAGIATNGLVGHFKHLVPPGMPAFLLPIMIPVEILSMFTKPFALMVRLFANMLAGHMVITALLLLIPLMAAISTAFGVMIIPVSLGLALFIMLLELLVALIQAYIFTLLTAIFIGMYAHPAH